MTDLNPNEKARVAGQGRSLTVAARMATPAARRKLLTRRGFMRAMGGAVVAGGATYAYGSAVEAHRLVVEHVTVPITGLAARWHGKRIVQLSDLHAGRMSLALIGRALEMAAELKPEVVAITGDFVDSKYVDPGPLCGLLRPFTAKFETLGVTGNHDFSNHDGDLTFVNSVCDALLGAGVRMLRNGVHQARAGAGEVCFVGVEDLWSGRLAADTLRFAGPETTVVVLSHNPDSYELLDPFRFHLMLSGHTHGGQVCLPLIGPLILPVKHRERAAGLFHLNAAHPERALYVTRGVGHLLRVRLFCPPEVTCITLRNPGMA